MAPNQIFLLLSKFEDVCSMRYFLDLTYDGGKYHGWQEQDNAISVQQVVNEALSKLLRSPTKCVGSGRTDAGVHALQQPVHIDVEQSWEKAQLCYKLNAILPKDIAVNVVKSVRMDAHARFSAMSRSYTYHIHTKRYPFKVGRSYFFSRTLDVGLINQCCQLLLDWKDFESFSRVHTDVNHFECDITEARWESANGQHAFYVTANRFLRGMVRALVGTLLDVGEKKLSLQEFALVLERRDRRAAGRAVPPEGLFLTAVQYPDDIYQ